jgi:hypothetical protein
VICRCPTRSLRTTVDHIEGKTGAEEKAMHTWGLLLDDQSVRDLTDERRARLRNLWGRGGAERRARRLHLATAAAAATAPTTPAPAAAVAPRPQAGSATIPAGHAAVAGRNC